MRWAGRILLSLLAVAVLLAGAVLLLGDRVELAGLAASRASATLGRAVTIGSLHVTPGRWLAVELHDATVANKPGGTRPTMATAARLTAEVDALSLLAGPLVLRRLAVGDLDVLLERVADGSPNWRAGAANPSPPPRTSLPTLLDATVTGRVVLRSGSGGGELSVGLDGLRLQSAAADAPTRLSGTGSYQRVPLQLDATLGSFAAYRDAATPFPADIHLASGATALRFQGTLARPLDLDGAHGTLTLDAPTPAALYGIAGIESPLQPALRLAGTLAHDEPVWRLSDTTGALADAAITAGMLDFQDAPHGQPDKLRVELAFDRLDLNALAPKPAAGRADLDLAVDRAPDTLLSAALTARALAYGPVRATDAHLAGSLTPGRVAVDDLSMNWTGARMAARGQVEAAGNHQGRIEAAIDLDGLDVQALRRALGLGDIPVTGRVAGRVAGAGTAATLNGAIRTGRFSAVLAMGGGGIARDVVALASTDPLRLLATPGGTAAIACALLVADMRAGAGTISPLRVRSSAGTVAGQGRFDLGRDTLDVVVASESGTTGALALDVPLRVSGPFASPTVRPAEFSAEGRTLLAQGDDLSRLPAGLQPFARSHPCAPGGTAPVRARPAPARPSPPGALERLFDRLR